MNQNGAGIQVNGAMPNGASQPPRNRMVVMRAHQDHVGVFAEEEQREAHGAVFDEEAGDDLALAFRQVERASGWSPPGSR